VSSAQTQPRRRPACLRSCTQCCADLRPATLLLLVHTLSPVPLHAYRPGKSGGRQKSIPCERCNVETCGSLQLPCGRLVILCEKCALNFYDVLIAKISKFEGPFEEFLLDQQGRGNSTKQEKEKGQASPRSPRKAADQQRAVLPKPADQQRHSTRLDRGAGDAVDGGAAKNRQAGDTVEPGAFLAAKGGHDTLARSHDIRGSRAGLGAGRRRTDRFVMASSGMAMRLVAAAFLM
jgi:hypothetical protein